MNFLPVKKYFRDCVTVRVLIVSVWLVWLSWLMGSWVLFLLLLPLYWHIFLKQDLVPGGW